MFANPHNESKTKVLSLSAMTRLSVNINKIATLRNARGGDIPNVLEAAKKAESFGAQGITVHPRPDERHIRYQDVRDLADNITTEFNVEGYPSRDFLDLVLETRPQQVTLVPDPPEVLTSNAGWDTIKHQSQLSEVVAELKSAGIRSSLFMECERVFIDAAAKTGADRIELYTEAYASAYEKDREKAIRPYRQAASWAHELGLGVNAGHDLNLKNLAFFVKEVPNLAEVSIGHALIADALYLGLENTIQMYLRQIELGYS